MLIYQFHHYVKPEMVEAYKEASLANARETLKEPGVIRFDVLQDAEDPTHFCLFEVYRDEAARTAHLETAHFLAWKAVALAAFARRGRREQFTAVFPEGEWCTNT